MAKRGGQRYRSHAATGGKKPGARPGFHDLPANRRSIFRASTGAEIGNILTRREHRRPRTLAGVR